MSTARRRAPQRRRGGTASSKRSENPRSGPRRAPPTPVTGRTGSRSASSEKTRRIARRAPTRERPTAVRAPLVRLIGCSGEPRGRPAAFARRYRQYGVRVGTDPKTLGLGQNLRSASYLRGVETGDRGSRLQKKGGQGDRFDSIAGDFTTGNDSARRDWWRSGMGRSGSDSLVFRQCRARRLRLRSRLHLWHACEPHCPVRQPHRNPALCLCRHGRRGQVLRRRRALLECCGLCLKFAVPAGMEVSSARLRLLWSEMRASVRHTARRRRACPQPQTALIGSAAVLIRHDT